MMQIKYRTYSVDLCNKSLHSFFQQSFPKKINLHGRKKFRNEIMFKLHVWITLKLMNNEMVNSAFKIHGMVVLKKKDFGILLSEVPIFICALAGISH